MSRHNFILAVSVSLAHSTEKLADTVQVKVINQCTWALLMII